MSHNLCEINRGGDWEIKNSETLDVLRSPLFFSYRSVEKSPVQAKRICGTHTTTWNIATAVPN
jgi:hypothetical protein